MCLFGLKFVGLELVCVELAGLEVCVGWSLLVRSLLVGIFCVEIYVQNF